jgi:heme/copper-type cytochrome/quinol oxidase subunit 2
MNPSPWPYSLLLLLVGLAFYMLPTFIAAARGKAHGTGGVVVVNLLLGWTVAGWVVAFIWACSGGTKAEARREEERHREMLEVIAGKS